MVIALSDWAREQFGVEDSWSPLRDQRVQVSLDPRTRAVTENHYLTGDKEVLLSDRVLGYLPEDLAYQVFTIGEDQLTVLYTPPMSVLEVTDALPDPVKNRLLRCVFYGIWD